MLALRVIVGLGLAYIVLLLLAWLFQERLAFPAPRARLPDPKRVGVENGEKVELVSGDGTKLVGGYLKPGEVGEGRGRLGKVDGARSNLPQPPAPSSTSRRAPSRGGTHPGIAADQRRRDGEVSLPATAPLPAPPVARQRRQRQAGPLSHPVVSRRRGSAGADGDGESGGGRRGGAGRGSPDSRRGAQ